MPLLSIVAPVYNELPETLGELVRQIALALAPITEDYEVILVDDGGKRDSWTTIAALGAADRRVRGVRFSRNFGQQIAISAGIDHAVGDWVVVMDSDLQDRPEVIPALYAKAREGFDVVFVDREMRPETRTYQFMAGTFYTILNLLSGQDFARKQANFSIISAQVANTIRQMREPIRFHGGLVRWAGFRSTSIPARHGKRFAGKASYNFAGRLRFAGRWIIGFSARLLYIAIFAGVTMALVSMGMAAYIVTTALMNPSGGVPGWPSVMTAVFFTAGITNIMLGILGIYVAQMVNTGRGRPLYVVETVTNAQPARAPVAAIEAPLRMASDLAARVASETPR